MAKIERFSLGEFLKMFSTEAQCREYLASLRWKSGYVCPKCGCRHDTGWPTDCINVPNAAAKFR